MPSYSGSGDGIEAKLLTRREILFLRQDAFRQGWERCCLALGKEGEMKFWESHWEDRERSYAKR